MPTYSQTASGGTITGGSGLVSLAVAPSSIYAGPVSALGDLIAGSATFQQWTGTTTSYAAKKFIYLSNIIEGAIVRPFCEILLPEGFGTDITGGQFLRDGNLWVAFESSIDPKYADDHYNASLAFLNTIGAIHVDVMNACYEPGTLMIQSITTSSPLQRSAISEEANIAPYMRISWVVEIGIRGG